MSILDNKDSPSGAPSDLRAWIDLLRSAGELVEINAEVDPYLEITEIADRTVKAGGPALLFKNPKGSGHSLLINQFGTGKRMCLAFGESSLDKVAQTFEEFVIGRRLHGSPSIRQL